MRNVNAKDLFRNAEIDDRFILTMRNVNWEDQTGDARKLMSFILTMRNVNFCIITIR